MAKHKNPWQYYWTLFWEAHGVAKGHWTRVFWILGYLATFGVARVPFVSDLLDNLPKLVAAAIPYCVIGLLLVIAVARVNWLRVKTLQAARKVRIAFLSDPQVVYPAEFASAGCSVLLDIQNPCDEAVMFERTWFLELYDDVDVKLGEYRGGPSGGLRQLPGNDRFDNIWLTFNGSPDPRHVVSRAVVRGTDIHGNTHVGEWNRAGCR